MGIAGLNLNEENTVKLSTALPKFIKPKLAKLLLTNFRSDQKRSELENSCVQMRTKLKTISVHTNDGDVMVNNISIKTCEAVFKKGKSESKSYFGDEVAPGCLMATLMLKRSYLRDALL